MLTFFKISTLETMAMLGAHLLLEIVAALGAIMRHWTRSL